MTPVTLEEATIEQLEAAVKEKRMAKVADRIVRIQAIEQELLDITERRKALKLELEGIKILPIECPNPHLNVESAFSQECKLCGRVY